MLSISALIGLTFLGGIGAALMGPTWQAIVPELVKREDVKSAVALDSLGTNIARSIGRPQVVCFLPPSEQGLPMAPMSQVTSSSSRRSSAGRVQRTPTTRCRKTPSVRSVQAFVTPSRTSRCMWCFCVLPFSSPSPAPSGRSSRSSLVSCSAVMQASMVSCLVQSAPVRSVAR